MNTLNVCRDIAMESTRSELAALIHRMSDETESYRIALYAEKRMVAELKAQMETQCIELRALHSALKNHAEAMDKLIK
jgi:hypothetical protein